jgi:hypothetical protein
VVKISIMIPPVVMKLTAMKMSFQPKGFDERPAVC